MGKINLHFAHISGMDGVRIPGDIALIGGVIRVGIVVPFGMGWDGGTRDQSSISAVRGRGRGLVAELALHGH